jgi:streptomycin 6-kinase
MADPIVNIGSDLARSMLASHSDAGAEWLRRLPALVAECARRWSLELEPPFPDVAMAYVAPARRADGAEVVLKVAPPTDHLAMEVGALEAFAGRGVAGLLETDATLGALLLERVRPGTPLMVLRDDEEATGITADVLRRLWRPVPVGHPGPTLEEWTAGMTDVRRRFDGGSGPFQETLLAEAESLYVELLARSPEPVLLHGDIHHGNILRSERGDGRTEWVAIDPRGIAGDPAYDVSTLLHNPKPWLLEQPDTPAVLSRRLEILERELGLERWRMRGWGLVAMVQAAVWSWDGGGGEWMGAVITCADALATVSP